MSCPYNAAAVVPVKWHIKWSCAPENRGCWQRLRGAGIELQVCRPIAKQFYADRPFILLRMYFRIYCMKLTCLHWTQSSVGQVWSPRRPRSSDPLGEQYVNRKMGDLGNITLSSKIKNIRTSYHWDRTRFSAVGALAVSRSIDMFLFLINLSTLFQLHRLYSFV
jgi:hypothetical protein